MNVKQDQSTITPAPLPPKVAAIRALIAADYVLIPLYKGKNPGFDGWEETAPGQYGETDLAARNYGVVLKPGDLVVDIDPRNFASGDNPVKRLIEKLGQPLKSWTIKTGGGGYHVYFRKPPDILVRNSLKDFSGIEFKSAGRQMVGPGSIHPDSGKEYVVASGNINEIADAPATLLTLIQRTAVPWADEAGTGTYINDAGTQGRYLDYLTNMAPPSGSFVVACRGRDMGLPPAVTLELMLEVWNPRRSGRKTIEELRVKVEHAYKYARGAVGAAHPSAAFDKIDAPSPPPPLPSPTTKEKDPEIAWNTSPQGKVLKTFQNLLNYMRLPAGGLHKIFAFNEFTGRVEFVNPAPWHRGRLPRYPGVGDDDLKLLKGYLSTRHGYETTVQNIEEAVTNVAYHDRFHPVREYLHGLKWDEKQRLDTWMRDYLGVAETPYTRACARKVLCAAVMRVMHPGIKFDHVLVLEGAQDVGKSTVVELLGGKWAADAPVDPHAKDTIQFLQGRWIVELAEMEVVRRVDEEALKAFISRKTDMARLAYGRTVGEFPRQSIFIATKNPRADGTYLKDDTGNRRWWPVRCEPTHGLGQMDFRGLKDARDQLFAEAMARMKTAPGEKLYMETAELKTAARDEAAQRHAEHEWTESIASWIERCDEKPETRRDFLTARDVFVDALDGSDRLLDRKSAMAIAQVMRALGWTTGYKRVSHRFCRGYLRPGLVSPETAKLMELVALL